ncbi:MAG: signal peptidase II [Clostridia bacterium]|nr:signal peptidase II [Clostridia bacterium]
MTNQETTEKKESPLKGSWLWGVLLFFILIFIDQATKVLADVYFNDYAEGVRKVVIIPNMIELCISYNRGIAFSMFSNSNETIKMAIVLSTGVMMTAIGVVYFKLDKRRTFLRVACVLVIAGGIGNLIDRVYYQVWDPASYAGGFRDGVRDMVRLQLVFDFGVCNFADFFISIGAVMLVFACLFFDSYAYCPVGKYKALAKEVEEKEAKREEEKLAKKQAKKLAKENSDGNARSVAVIGKAENADEPTDGLDGKGQ